MEREAGAEEKERSHEMSDIMTSMGLDITDFKNSLNQLNESSQKMAMGMKGNMLALGAGVLGVGAIFYNFSKQVGDEFDGLIEGSKQLSDEFKKIGADSGFAAINSALSESLKKSEQLNIQIAKSNLEYSNNAGMILKIARALGSGKSFSEMDAELQQEITRQNSEKVKLIVKANEASAAELAMSELKLNGTKEEVAALERKIALEKKLQEIIDSSFDANTKLTLIANAESIAANEAEARARAETAAMDKFFAEEEEAAMKEFYSEQENLESEAAKQREHDRDQKAAFLKAEEDAVKKLQDEEKKRGEEVQAASEKMQAAEQQLVDIETEKLSLKDQAAIQSGKVADAEENLAKAAKGTVEWYERKAALAKEQLRLETILNERAKAFAKSTAGGRKFDRDQEKQRKKDAKARAREDKYDASPAGQKAAARRAANGIGGNVAPRPMMQPNAPAAPAAGGQGGAVAVMQVASLVVGELKSK